MTGPDIKETVREKYGQAALRVLEGEKSNCCGDPITSRLYDAGETTGLPEGAVLASLGCGGIAAAERREHGALGQPRGLDAGETTGLPEGAVLASLGCGNPTALAALHPGETVLDLGSGGGIDVLLSARRVGPTGKAYGLDMTDEMLALARENQRKAGVTNVEFLKGEIEHIPLPDASVDVIISNCVINLSADKRRVLGEAFRVLRPGGRFAVSDVVVRGQLPSEVRRSIEAWVGCVAGALEEEEFKTLLAQQGFEEIGIEPTRIYRVRSKEEHTSELQSRLHLVCRL